jgi:hypothetical protein
MHRLLRSNLQPNFAIGIRLEEKRAMSFEMGKTALLLFLVIYICGQGSKDA